jgi:hypothetical protein
MAAHQLNTMTTQQLQALANDPRQVNITWRASNTATNTQVVWNNYPRNAALASAYCTTKLHQAQGQTLTILITGSSFEHIKSMLKSLGKYLRGDRSLPPVGDSPYFDALKLNEAARFLGVHWLAEKIWDAFKALRSTPSLADISAVMTAYRDTDTRPSIAINQLAAAIVDKRVDAQSPVLANLKESNETFRKALEVKVTEQEKAAEKRARREKAKERRSRQRKRGEKVEEPEEELVADEPPNFEDPLQFPAIDSDAERESRRRRF